jgi:hypothetical protein
VPGMKANERLGHRQQRRAAGARRRRARSTAANSEDMRRSYRSALSQSIEHCWPRRLGPARSAPR